MARKRKQYSNDFKFKVALKAVKGVKTTSQMGSEYNLHPTQIGNWKSNYSAIAIEIALKGLTPNVHRRGRRTFVRTGGHCG